MAVFPRLGNDTNNTESFKMETFLTFLVFSSSPVQFKIPSILIVEWAASSPIGLNHGLYKQKLKAFRLN